jgi:uncharacterized protein YdhG (YjbR/CyaY superfamily)
MNNKLVSVESYMKGFDKNTQKIMLKIRALILKHAKGVEEQISYAMPAYKLYGKPLIYFAAYKSHIGLYAMPSGKEWFKNELANYKLGKGSVQFQLNETIPYELIERIILFKVSENKTKFSKP